MTWSFVPCSAAMLPFQHEVRLHGALDRLFHLGVGLVEDLAHLLADALLPLRQPVDVRVHPRVGRIGHGPMMHHERVAMIPEPDPIASGLRDQP